MVTMINAAISDSLKIVLVLLVVMQNLITAMYVILTKQMIVFLIVLVFGEEML